MTFFLVAAAGLLHLCLRINAARPLHRVGCCPVQCSMCCPAAKLPPPSLLRDLCPHILRQILCTRHCLRKMDLLLLLWWLQEGAI